jgi:glycosyltransferase involved in cell wall biosynthesis
MREARESPYISVVVPIYNEEPNISRLLEQLQRVLDRFGRRYEVVAVDDGSVDASRRLLADAMSGRPWLRVLAFGENRGQTAAFLAGFRAARGDVVVTIDADLQNDPEDIPTLVDLIGRYDVACGVRSKRDDPIQKRWGSKIANAFRRWMLKDNIKDTGCSLKAFRRECVDSIPSFNGMHRFFPILMAAHGYTVTQTDVNHRPREAGISKYGTLDRLVKSLPDLFAVRWMSRRRLSLVAEELGQPSADTPDQEAARE